MKKTVALLLILLGLSSLAGCTDWTSPEGVVTGALADLQAGKQCAFLDNLSGDAHQRYKDPAAFAELRESLSAVRFTRLEDLTPGSDQQQINDAWIDHQVAYGIRNGAAETEIADATVRCQRWRYPHHSTVCEIIGIELK